MNAEQLIDEYLKEEASKKELLARFGKKMAKPFKKEDDKKKKDEKDK